MSSTTRTTLLVALAAIAIVFGGLRVRDSLRSQPPVTGEVAAGERPVQYEEELGPRPGLLDELKRAGQVPPDAIDDGRGHFVSPAVLSESERRAAAAAVARRGRRQETSHP